MAILVCFSLFCFVLFWFGLSELSWLACEKKKGKKQKKRTGFPKVEGTSLFSFLLKFINKLYKIKKTKQNKKKKKKKKKKNC